MINLNSSACRIKYARNLAGLNRQGFAEKFDISANTLQSWELGRTSLTEKGAQRLCEALLKINVVCTIQWLLKGNGERPFLYEVSDLQLNDSICEESLLMQEIDILKSLHVDYLISTITDSGMTPFYNLGDYVGGKSVVNTTDILKIIGENCIIKTTDGLTLVRRLMHSNVTGKYNLYTLNCDQNIEPVAAYVSIESVAKIIWHRKRN